MDLSQVMRYIFSRQPGEARLNVWITDDYVRDAGSNKTEVCHAKVLYITSIFTIPQT